MYRKYVYNFLGEVVNIFLALYSSLFTLQIEQEVKVIWQKAPHGGLIPRLGVTPGVESCTIEFLG